MNRIKLAYQDTITGDKPRQLEFVGSKNTEPTALSHNPKKQYKKHYGLALFGVPKGGQTCL